MLLPVRPVGREEWVRPVRPVRPELLEPLALRRRRLLGTRPVLGERRDRRLRPERRERRPAPGWLVRSSAPQLEAKLSRKLEASPCPGAEVDTESGPLRGAISWPPDGRSSRDSAAEGAPAG